MLILDKKTIGKQKNKQPRPLKYLFLLSLVILMGIIFYFVPYNTDEVAYLRELTQKKAKEEYLTKDELLDYCELLFKLKDSIPLECVCLLDDNNWKKPPKSPNSLSDKWFEISTDLQKQKTTTRTFQHRLYGFKLNFDTNPKSHWHRFNPLSKTKHDFYLDNNCNPVLKGSKESHIYTP